MYNTTTNAATKTISVLYAAVAWLVFKNMRTDYGDEADRNKTRNAIADNGWLPGYPIPVTAIDPINELPKEMEKRQKMWDRRKGAVVNTESKLKLETFEELMCESGSDGVKVLRKPDYAANAGFRRGSLPDEETSANQGGAFLPAMEQRRRSSKLFGDGMPANNLLPYVPVTVKEYANEADRVYDQQLENESQNEGTKKMNPLEQLATTKKLFDLGCKPVDIRELYKGSRGQKLFYIVHLDDIYKELGLYDRFQMANSESADHIPWGPCLHSDMSLLIKRWDAQRKKAEGLMNQLSRDEKALEPITAEEIDGYFRGKNAKNALEKPVVQMMKKADIGGNIVSAPLKLARLAYEHVNGSTKGASMVLAEKFKEPLNDTFDMVQAGKGEILTQVIAATKEYESIMNDVALLLKDGFATEVKAALALIRMPPVTQVTADADDSGNTPEQLSKREQKRRARELANAS